jgi:hypothetical protein
LPDAAHLGKGNLTEKMINAPDQKISKQLSSASTGSKSKDSTNLVGIDSRSTDSQGKEISRLQTQLAEYKEYYQGQSELLESEYSQRLNMESELQTANSAFQSLQK